MSRKQEAITLTVTPEEKAALEALAYRFHCRWGQRGNVSALVRKIAAGKVDLVLSRSGS